MIRLGAAISFGFLSNRILLQSTSIRSFARKTGTSDIPDFVAQGLRPTPRRPTRPRRRDAPMFDLPGSALAKTEMVRLQEALAESVLSGGVPKGSRLKGKGMKGQGICSSAVALPSLLSPFQKTTAPWPWHEWIAHQSRYSRYSAGPAGFSEMPLETLSDWAKALSRLQGFEVLKAGRPPCTTVEEPLYWGLVSP